jgi:hypothetical protein
MEVDVDEVIDEVLEAVGYAYKEVSDEHVRVSRGKQAWSGSSLAVVLNAQRLVRWDRRQQAHVSADSAQGAH